MCSFSLKRYSVFTYNLVFNKKLNNKVKTHFFYSKNIQVRSTVLLKSSIKKSVKIANQLKYHGKPWNRG